MKAYRALISAMVAAAAMGLAAGGSMAQNGHEGHDHSAAKHDHTPVAGGIVVEIGDYDAELVASAGEIALLLKDHDGKEQASDGFKASVLVLVGADRKGPFELAPAGGNKLQGKGDGLAAGSKVIVTLTDASGKAAQGRVEVK